MVAERTSRLAGSWIAAAGVSASVLCAGSAASAQAATGFAVDRYDPTPAGDVFFASEHPVYTGREAWWALRAGVVLDYAHNPLVVRPVGADPVPIIANQLVLHGLITASFLDRFAIHLQLPITLLEDGRSGTAYGVNTAATGRAEVGDLRIGARVRIAGDAERDPFSLHVGGSLYIGLNDRASNASDNFVRGRVQATVAGRVAGIMRYSAGLGVHLRNPVTIAGTQITNEIYGTAAVGFGTRDGRLTIGPEVVLATALDGRFNENEHDVELLLGAHYLIADTFLVGLGAGPGLTHGAGTPAVRALLQLEYAPAAKNTALAPAPRDTDRDGVMDPDDQCPNEPRGEHPDASRPGCPTRDTDRDTVLDPDDRCVDVPQGDHPDPTRPGCPDVDTDHDGVFDREDLCVGEPMGDHPDTTRRGCPQRDGDNDGVLDTDDQCPAEPQGAHPDPARRGCPMGDRDHDTVTDDVDHCPDQPGSPSPDPNRNGCPGLVRVENGLIRILTPVYFATGRDVILARSNPVLNAVADALRSSPQIHRVSIEGHTDSAGDDAANMQLSQRRAESVLRWLSTHGIDASRLEAHGFGETRPLESNGTATGRASNRRVEFRITDPAPPASH